MDEVPSLCSSSNAFLLDCKLLEGRALPKYEEFLLIRFVQVDAVYDHEDSIQSHSNNMQHQIIHILTISPGHVVIPFHPPKHPVIFTLGIVGGTLELYLL